MNNRLGSFFKNRVTETACIITVSVVYISMAVYACYLQMLIDKEQNNTFEETLEIVSSSETVEELSVVPVFAGEKTYIAIGNGKKFHVDGCSYIKENSKTRTVDMIQIENEGLTPCSRCIEV